MPQRREANRRSARKSTAPASAAGPGEDPPKPFNSYSPDPSVRDRAALAAALDPIITIDFRGIVQSASDSLHRVLGWKPAELVGQNVSVLMPEPHHSAHDGYLADYQRTGRTTILNRPRRFDALKKDGTRLPVELCVSRAEVPAGGAPLFVGIIRDMSVYDAAERSRDDERVRSQQLLSEQTSALQQANLRLRMSDRMASIGTLAAGLGHDMNNVLLPVRSRLNALKVAGKAGRISPSERKHIEAIAASVAYLQQLADGLHFLALDPEADEDARNQGSSTDLRQWWLQVGPLLSKAVPRQVRVIAKFGAKLPPIALATHGLTQAILNLVVNAGEAISLSGNVSTRDRIRLTADAAVRSNQPCVMLRVSDNGPGMTDEVKRRAFEMFYTTKPRGMGTGLGLTLVRNVVERPGGTVEIDSAPGRGTSVTLCIPVSRSAGKAKTSRASAVLTLRNGRTASIVRHLLESRNVLVRTADDPSGSDIWVIDESTVDPARVKRWNRKRPSCHLVLIGRPLATTLAALREIEPLIVQNPNDFDALQTALSQIAAPR